MIHRKLFVMSRLDRRDFSFIYRLLPDLLLCRLLFRFLLSRNYFLRARYEHFTLVPLFLHACDTFFYLLTQIRPKLLCMFRNPHPKLFYIMLSLWMELPFRFHLLPELSPDKKAFLLLSHTRLECFLPDLVFDNEARLPWSHMYCVL